MDRYPLAHLPTALEPMDRVAAALGMARGTLWVKRDDCTGLAGGGSKARKLEYLVGEALAQGCDTLVTGGGPQSNHARMTAAAARRAGMSCALLLESDTETADSGNLLLDRVLGADVRWVPPASFEDAEARMRCEADTLRARGRRPYVIGIGGSSPLGARGMADAARELPSDVDLVVVATGSGGLQAGLAAGLGDHDRVLAFHVGTRPGIASLVDALAASIPGVEAPRGAARVDRSQVGPGYAIATPACREAIEMAARTEALLLDPVYTGKAMAGLIAAGRAGELRGKVVFWHSGGLPGLLAEGALA